MPAWPALATIGFVAGRLATEEDVAAGDAVFVLRPDGLHVEPLDLQIPQYGLHNLEYGRAIPVIVIQAERAGETEILGLRDLDGEMIAATRPEVDLLGTAVRLS